VFLFLAGAGLAWVWGGGAFKPPQRKPPKTTSYAVDLQTVLDQTQTLMWAELNQQVVWGNEAYNHWLGPQGDKGILAFNLQSRLSPDHSPTRGRLDDLGSGKSAEFCLKKNQIDGFDYYNATNAARLIESEQELQRFIQTLTETFAHLPIGLAIFDKRRDLVMFNPALEKLLDLPAEWLARRPSLMSFLDRLRNEGIMPEPQDFQSIRQEFKELESGSVNGTYRAEWTLAGGQVYGVVGRPHAKGGLALLFEDISKSVMVERLYRAELEQLYSALDCLADGVAIFDPTGELVFVNDAFDDLWHSDLAGVVNPVNVIDFSRLLQGKCRPSPAWGDFREFVLDASERTLWHAEVDLVAGGRIQMSFSPISGGQVLCEFKLANASSTHVVERTKHSA